MHEWRRGVCFALQCGGRFKREAHTTRLLVGPPVWVGWAGGASRAGGPTWALGSRWMVAAHAPARGPLRPPPDPLNPALLSPCRERVVYIGVRSCVSRVIKEEKIMV